MGLAALQCISKSFFQANLDQYKKIRYFWARPIKKTYTQSKSPIKNAKNNIVYNIARESVYHLALKLLVLINERVDGLLYIKVVG